MRNKGVIFLLGILLISLISASGIEIVGQSEFSLNKTEGIDQMIIFRIKNTENFDFYNLTSLNNDVLELEKIDKLSINEERNVSAIIKSDSYFNGSIKLKAVYLSDVGTSNNLYEIEIDYQNGINICSLSPIYVGDSVKFINLVNDYIVLQNLGTNQIIQQIAKNDSYTTLFESPTILRYVALRQGFIFTNVCSIDVLDTTGYVHNPSYDAEINLNLNVLYKQTTIETTFLNSEYTLNWNERFEDLFSIKNNGNETAKDMYLTGDWIGYFSVNNFDLSPGQSKTISYKISPDIQTTEQTGKDYKKNLTIQGNFETITKEFNISIRYTEISEQQYYNQTINNALVRAWYVDYCNNINPSDPICEKEIIYTNESGSNEFNTTMNEDQLKGLFESWFNFIDKYDVDRNIEMEQTLNQSDRLLFLEQNYLNMSDGMNRMAEKSEEDNALSIFFVIFFSVVFLGSIISFLIFKQKIKNKRLKIGGYKKGEKLW